MKKKSLLLLAFIPFLIGCNQESSGPIAPVPYVEPDPEIRSDVVYLGFSDQKTYTPSSNVTFTVSIDDLSIVSYDSTSKTFFSTTKAGTTLAHFVSPKLTVNVSVTVQDDGTAPLFYLDETNIDLNVSDTYQVNASLSFRGVDGFSSSTGLHYLRVDEDGESSSIDINEKTITITANSIGKDIYTIYTEYAGLVLSKNLTVNVIENKAFVVIGSKLSFDDNGPIYNIPMYHYDENPIDLSKDLSVSKGGKSVPFSDLTITTDSTDIISISNNVINVHKAGKASITVKYLNDTSVIAVNVYKSILDHKYITIEDNTFALNFDVTISAKTRQYTASKEVKKSFELKETDYSLTAPVSLEIDGKVVENTSETPITYLNNVVTFTAASFDISCWGEKKITLIMEGKDFLVKYSFDMLFITKEISKKADMDNYLTLLNKDEVIFGYYKLINDIDYQGYYSSQDYIKNADNGLIGFRGILTGEKEDGGNYKLLNIRAAIYGLFYTIGEGAKVMNIDFDNIILNNSSKTSAISSYIFGASITNININPTANSNLSSIGPESDPCASGIISCQKTENSTFEDVTINANTHTIKSLFGKTANNNKFVDTVINCVDIIYFCTNTLYDGNLEPTNGVKFATTKIDGITINRTK